MAGFPQHAPWMVVQGHIEWSGGKGVAVFFFLEVPKKNGDTPFPPLSSRCPRVVPVFQGPFRVLQNWIPLSGCFFKEHQSPAIPSLENEHLHKIPITPVFYPGYGVLPQFESIFMFTFFLNGYLDHKCTCVFFSQYLHSVSISF